LKCSKSSAENPYSDYSLCLLITSARPYRFATVHAAADFESVSVSRELEFSDKIRSFAAVNEIEYTDHCIFDGTDLRSFKDEGLF
jgi:hypothetical protein